MSVSHAKRPLIGVAVALAAIAALLAGLLAGCGSAGASASADATANAAAGTDSATTATPAKPLILAMTGIWADVVRNVACANSPTAPAQVVSLIPDGGDPHVFEPSLADRARLDRSSLIVANGLGLEAGLADTLEAVAQAGTAIFAMGDHVDTIRVAIPTDHAGSFDEDDHGADNRGDTDRGNGDDHEDDNITDPHIWFDPRRVAGAVEPLAQALIEHAGLPADEINACAQDYRNRLISLDAQLADQFGQLPPERRRIVTNHDSLGYLADRYSLKVIGTISPAASTIAATNPAQLAELAELIGANGVPVIFTETQRTTDDAEALASRAGQVRLVPLYTETLGAPGSGADTYIGMLATDAQRIVDALS